MQLCLNQPGCSAEHGRRGCSLWVWPRPPKLRSQAGWVPAAATRAHPMAKGDSPSDSVYSPFSTNTHTSVPTSPPGARCPNTIAGAPPSVGDAESKTPPEARRCWGSRVRGTARAVPSLGNFRKCQFVKQPATPPAPGCKLRVLPSFYLGRRGPAGRSAERPALPARPASCSPCCPGSWSRGNTPEIARKA